MTRRNHLRFLAFTGSLLLTSPLAWARQKGPHIACQQYPWTTFYRREGKNWHANLPMAMQEVARAEIPGFEPAFDSVAQVEALRPLLKQHSLISRSLYVNSVLHEKKAVDGSLQAVLAILDACQGLGLEIVVTNPSPIRWGGPENKTDAQLKTQARALDQLGQQLRARGLKLAYHNHDAEMRLAAREFHHMMQGTDPANVHLCLDAHWIYRGAGDSQLALFDIVKHYQSRIVELHLRQSQGGVWTEAFGPGDLDYERLAEQLLAAGQRPHLVLEQAVESGTPQRLGALKAHQQSLAYAREVFAGFG